MLITGFGPEFADGYTPSKTSKRTELKFPSLNANPVRMSDDPVSDQAVSGDVSIGSNRDYEITDDALRILDEPTDSR